MATLGIIGSGSIGGTVARLAVNGGLDVVLSNSRGPETLADLVADLGPRARAATPAEAAAAGDWVLVSVPVKAYESLPREAFAGKTVIDTGNYYPQRDGTIEALENGSTTNTELFQNYLGESAQVVKAFNNIYFKHLALLNRPTGAQDRTALPIAGDDAAAKRYATELLDLLGYDAVDAGPLAQGRLFGPGTPAYGLPYAERAGESSGYPAAGPASADFASRPARPAPAAEIRALLEKAQS
ncbi:NAD(P)-binding domain-containing protein [Actinoallomurus spadix]|uniref:NAD(P)-binding domain-containing protein n=1 Tax=Actinoallomurus spadix TaxID=79912 RepID=A0ABN0WI70_9ACTN|nr:NAD(P)-binding domain-containing protein [Actinoallomurus spadix]MCO5989931.1 NAD(P)-binding domain-containing protein [Actinoallomurus spadix]